MPIETIVAFHQDGLISDELMQMLLVGHLDKQKVTAVKKPTLFPRSLKFLWWLVATAWWFATLLFTLWWELFTIKLNKFGYRHWRRGDYELAVIAAMTHNLSGLGVIFDVMFIAIDAVESIVDLGIAGNMRFIYYAIALTQSPIYHDITSDAMMLMLLVATGRESLWALPFLFLTPHACNTMTIFMMPIHRALGTIATLGWAYHLRRLYEPSQPSRMLAARVILISLTLFVVDIYYRTLAFDYINYVGSPNHAAAKGKGAHRGCASASPPR
jgi:hypothetical protein